MGGSIKQLRYVFAIFRDRLPWRNQGKFMDVVKAMRADGDLETLSALYFDIPESMRDFINMMAVRDEFYGTKIVFNKLYNCYLLIPILASFALSD